MLSYEREMYIIIIIEPHEFNKYSNFPLDLEILNCIIQKITEAIEVLWQFPRSLFDDLYNFKSFQIEFGSTIFVFILPQCIRVVI